MRSLFLAFFLLASCRSPESTWLPPDPGLNRMIEQPRLDSYESLPPGLQADKGRPKMPEGVVSYRALEQTKSAKPAVDEALLELGERRFGVYCAPCHGAFGQGQTEVSKFMRDKPPGSLHTKAARAMGADALERVIDQGTGGMLGLGAQLDTRSRWATVAWVKLLQRSQVSAQEAP